MDRFPGFRAAVERVRSRVLDGDLERTNPAPPEHSAPSFEEVLNLLRASPDDIEGDLGLFLQATATQPLTDPQLCEIGELLIAKYHAAFVATPALARPAPTEP